MACNRVIKNPMHPFACEMARGAICAQAQQKFEEYYQTVFQHQKDLKAGSALEIAREMGLDAARFETCLTDPATQARVSQDIEEGVALNVESTPTFFINGRRITGAQPPEIWNAVIEHLLK
jgi:protein-disulfide isomerase